MIKRLRPALPTETFNALHSTMYDHTQWDEHIKRVAWTVDQLNTKAMRWISTPIIADLSCGDGAVLRDVVGGDVSEKIYGDLVWAPHINVIGSIEQTIETTTMDMLICSETLEHLDDPQRFMHQVRRRTRYAAFTTPLGEWDDSDDGNYLHYWGWDEEGMRSMLLAADLYPLQFAVLKCDYYTYQLWVVQSRGLR